MILGAGGAAEFVDHRRQEQAVPTSLLVPCRVHSALAPLSLIMYLSSVSSHLQGIEETAYVVVGVRQRTRVDFHHSRIEALLRGRFGSRQLGAA